MSKNLDKHPQIKSDNNNYTISKFLDMNMLSAENLKGFSETICQSFKKRLSKLLYLALALEFFVLIYWVLIKVKIKVKLPRRWLYSRKC